MPNLIQLGSAVSAEQHAGEHRHLSHGNKPAATVTDALDDVKGLLVNDRFMRILKYRPLRRIVPDCLFALERLLSGTEVDRMPQVFLPLQDIRYGALLPCSRLLRLLCGTLQSQRGVMLCIVIKLYRLSRKHYGIINYSPSSSFIVQYMLMSIPSCDNRVGLFVGIDVAWAGRTVLVLRPE